jgi:dienelactone hydrolase
LSADIDRFTTQSWRHTAPERPRGNRAAIAYLIALVLFCVGGPAAAQQVHTVVHFPSLDGNDGRRPPTVLAGHIFRPLDQGRHSALVFLHGCGGLIHDGDLDERETSWAGELNRLGYAVLMVDSHWPRGIGSTCSLRVTNPDEWMKLMLKREDDAYGALQFLAAQPFVESNRIGVIGWSLGGGVVLLATRSGERARLNGTGSASFRAAVAFYPALCNDDEQPPGWSNEIPLLLLQGASDTWTRAAPCKRFVENAVARGARIDMQLYPGAYHAFDATNIPLQLLPIQTRPGTLPYLGSDPAARGDAFERVPAFLARYLAD